MKLALYSLVHPVTALGPGRRAALWVSGCSLGCRECITPQLWNRDAGWSISVERVLQRLLRLDAPLDGITLTGGEPFEQAEALALLLDGVIAERPAWNILAFSGHRMKEIQRMDNEAQHLLQNVDVLVAGRYARNASSPHPLIASRNQTIHYLTTRGKSLQAAIDGLQPNTANLAYGADDRQLLVGIIEPQARTAIHSKLGI